MNYKSKDLYIGDESYRKIFWKKYEDNVYKIFIGLDDRTLVKEKYSHLEIEFHMIHKKYPVYFVKKIYYKKGRTILSCMKEMIRFLEGWNVNAIGHFVVWVN